jgi:ER-bound oxygenase mpaB/B'/Rubber oxygenase, catalytic domain
MTSDPSSRLAILRTIEQLDPERDHQRIVHLSFGYDFPWDSIRALEIALYRTYCVPSISALLDRTGEFHTDGQRRYDDTSLLVAEMCEWGYEHGRGKEALDRMNWAHAHYRIANDDFLYVLSTFIYEPVRWIDAVGWRPTCLNERLGYYWFWREIGKRMGVTDIPPSYDAFEAWSRSYEGQHFRFADTSHRVGASTRDIFAGWFPRLLTPVVRYAIYAMLDDDMIAAFGFPKPLPLTRPLLRRALWLRGRAVRWLPPLREPHFFTDDRNRTHPDGYEIAGLGPRRLVAAEKRRQEVESHRDRADHHL